MVPEFAKSTWNFSQKCIASIAKASSAWYLCIFFAQKCDIFDKNCY